MSADAPTPFVPSTLPHSRDGPTPSLPLASVLLHLPITVVREPLVGPPTLLLPLLLQLLLCVWVGRGLSSGGRNVWLRTSSADVAHAGHRNLLTVIRRQDRIRREDP